VSEETDFSEDFPEFMSHTDQVAVSHHEIFSSYVKAGFTEDQALDMLKVMVAVSMKNSGSGE
jgi:hypothetical protein